MFESVNYCYSCLDLLPRQSGNAAAPELTGGGVEERRQEVVPFKTEEVVPYNMPVRGKTKHLSLHYTLIEI